MANYFEKASRLEREIKKEYDTELIFDTIDFYGEQALLEVMNRMEPGITLDDAAEIIIEKSKEISTQIEELKAKVETKLNEIYDERFEELES